MKTIHFYQRKIFSNLSFRSVVRTDTLKGRRGRLPSKPKSPSSRQPNSFQTQFCRFYNDSTPNPASHDFSKLNVKTKFLSPKFQ